MTAITPENQIPAGQEATRALDAALGLETITVRLPSEALRGLEREAVKQGMPTQALARNLLQAYGLQAADRATASTVTLEVIAERARQDAKWGGPDHDDQHGLEDFCGFINQRTADLARGFETTEHARKRMIQIAALAVAAVESMDRKNQARAGRRFLSEVRTALQVDESPALVQSNSNVKIPFVQDEWSLGGTAVQPDTPKAPVAVLDAITAYGDARADGDVNAGAHHLAKCIGAIRGLMRPASVCVQMSHARPVNPGWYWYALPGTWVIQPALVYLDEGELWYALDAIPEDGADDGYEMNQCSEDALWSVEPIQSPQINPSISGESE